MTTKPAEVAGAASSAAPPAAGSPNPVDASAIAGWRQALAAWLAQHKAYPEDARRLGEEGTVAIRFSIDRAGHVLDATVLHGSGSAILDAATTGMLRNAILPRPPAMSADQITISVQIHYKLAE